MRICKFIFVLATLAACSLEQKRPSGQIHHCEIEAHYDF